jgi:hypothetical protein
MHGDVIDLSATDGCENAMQTTVHAAITALVQSRIVSLEKACSWKHQIVRKDSVGLPLLNSGKA